jgi:RHS repeat-associated protein
MPASYAVPGFPGQSRTLADLYYNMHRDYDSSTGRYIQADPIGLDGGPSPYSYAMNNPLRYMDPSGLEIANLFPYNEPGMRSAANRSYSNLDRNAQKSGYHVYGHGSSVSQCVGNRSGCMKPQDFAAWLNREGSNYRRGTPIHLNSCDTGSLDYGFAQNLADRMDVPVYAPTAKQWWIPYVGVIGISQQIPVFWGSGMNMRVVNIPNPFAQGSIKRFNPDASK